MFGHQSRWRWDNFSRWCISSGFLIILCQQSIQKWGNHYANLYWEAHLKPGHVPPEQCVFSFSDKIRLELFTIYFIIVKWNPSSVQSTSREDGLSMALRQQTLPYSITALRPQLLPPNLHPHPLSSAHLDQLILQATAFPPAPL